jgi:hypothetical protein
MSPWFRGQATVSSLSLRAYIYIRWRLDEGGTRSLLHVSAPVGFESSPMPALTSDRVGSLAQSHDTSLPETLELLSALAQQAAVELVVGSPSSGPQPTHRCRSVRQAPRCGRSEGRGALCLASRRGRPQYLDHTDVELASEFADRFGHDRKTTRVRPRCARWAPRSCAGEIRSSPAPRACLQRAERSDQQLDQVSNGSRSG